MDLFRTFLIGAASWICSGHLLLGLGLRKTRGCKEEGKEEGEREEPLMEKESEWTETGCAMGATISYHRSLGDMTHQFPYVRCMTSAPQHHS